MYPIQNTCTLCRLIQSSTEENIVYSSDLAVGSGRCVQTVGGVRTVDGLEDVAFHSVSYCPCQSER